MVLKILLVKIKSVIAFIVNLVKRSLCCFRRRRLSDSEYVPLTGVGVVPPSYQPGDNKEEAVQWVEDWPVGNTVQDHIEDYRRNLQGTPQEPPPPPPDYFQDMEPEIRKQRKMLIKNQSNQPDASRLSFVPDVVVSGESELGSWEEGERRGWAEAENWTPERMIRESKRMERYTRRPLATKHS